MNNPKEERESFVTNLARDLAIMAHGMWQVGHDRKEQDIASRIAAYIETVVSHAIKERPLETK